MASTLVQFRADEELRAEATRICNALGLDLQTYLRMAMARLVRESGIPFSTSLEDQPNRGARAMRLASRIAAEHGISDLSLDEINCGFELMKRGESIRSVVVY